MRPFSLRARSSLAGKKDPRSHPTLETAVLEVVAGDTHGIVAQPPLLQPSVRVSTPDGLSLPDVEVSWTPAEGDGTAAETTLTDAGGVAIAAFSCAVDTEGAPWCWRGDYGPTPSRIFLKAP